MPFTVLMPKLSPTMEEGAIVKWHVKEGDHLDSGALLLEVATDKATVEHNALDEGYLRKILVKEGESAKVGQPIAIFTESKEESIEGYTPEGTSPVNEPESTQEESKKEEKKASAKSSEGAAMMQPSFEIAAPLKDYQFPINQDSKEYFPASPLAKKIAKEQGLDLSSVKGSGPNGRIMSRDLELSSTKSYASFGNRDIPTDPPGSFEEMPLSPMRKVIGKRLQESKTFIPHFYVSQDIDAKNLIHTREELKKHGIKLTFNDFIVKAVALALRKHPAVNSGFNAQNQTIVRFKTIDISIAVSIDGGLITPIVRHADYKNLGFISHEVKQLVSKAQEQKLSPEEYQGGSFTISNLGMYGISDFSAIINPPQSAILAVSAILDQPVVKNGHVVAGKVMRLTFSFDHRVVDGAEGAQFAQTLKELLENPSILLL